MKVQGKIVALGIFFLLLVTTFNSFSHIVTFIYENHSSGYRYMGPIVLSANYIAFMIANSFAPSVRLKYTTQMKVAAVCYSLNYAVEALTLEGGWGILMSLLGACAGGYGAAILWVCYGAYVKKLCKDNMQEHKQGRYFALLNVFTFSSTVMGSIIITFCLRWYSYQTYFIILTLIGLCSLVFCALFVEDIQKDEQIIIVKENKWQSVKQAFAYYKDMRAIVPTLIVDGILLAFVATASTKLMPQGSSDTSVGVFLIFLGLGSMLGGYLSGYLSDKMHMKSVARLAFVFIVSACLLTLLELVFRSTQTAYVCAFVWGYARQFLEGWLYVACSRNYRGDLRSYANIKQLHSLSYCAFELVLVLFSLEIPQAYLMLAFILMCPVCVKFLQALPQAQEYPQSRQAKKNNSNQYETISI